MDAAIERARRAGPFREVDEVAVVVVDLRAALLDFPRHRAVRAPQRWLEALRHQPCEPLPPQNPRHGSRAERADLTEFDPGRGEDAKVLLKQREEQPPGGGEREELPV